MEREDESSTNGCREELGLCIIIGVVNFWHDAEGQIFVDRNGEGLRGFNTVHHGNNGHYTCAFCGWRTPDLTICRVVQAIRQITRDTQNGCRLITKEVISVSSANLTISQCDDIGCFRYRCNGIAYAQTFVVEKVTVLTFFKWCTQIRLEGEIFRIVAIGNGFG